MLIYNNILLIFLFFLLFNNFKLLIHKKKNIYIYIYINEKKKKLKLFFMKNNYKFLLFY